MIMEFASLNEYCQRVVIPSLGEDAADFDVNAIASDTAKWTGTGFVQAANVDFWHTCEKYRRGTYTCRSVNALNGVMHESIHEDYGAALQCMFRVMDVISEMITRHAYVVSVLAPKGCHVVGALRTNMDMR